MEKKELDLFQAQRPTLEHSKIHPQQTDGCQLYLRPPQHLALEQVALVAHRPQQIEAGHGWGSGEQGLADLEGHQVGMFTVTSSSYGWPTHRVEHSIEMRSR